MIDLVYMIFGISIHAPARGATMLDAGFRRSDVVFQSTLPRGERLLCRCYLLTTADFNPRSREGSDVAEILHNL